MTLTEPRFEPCKIFDTDSGYGWRETRPAPGPGTFGQFPVKVWEYISPFRESFNNPDGSRVEQAARVNLLDNGQYFGESFGLHKEACQAYYGPKDETGLKTAIQCEVIEWSPLNSEPFRTLEDAMRWCEDQMRRTGVLNPDDK